MANHAVNLSSSGNANRWNKRGQRVIYASSSRSLATLELIVHRNNVIPIVEHRVMVISMTDNNKLIKQIRINELPDNWQRLTAYSNLQDIGAKWYNSQETLVLKVPSAVILHEYNYVINTEHPGFSKEVKLLRIEDYFWDKRLFQK